MKFTGKVFKFGKNIDTDSMFPGKYLYEFRPEEVAKHAMEGIDPDFVSKVKPGDIILAGPNFGCGSAREQAAMTLKLAGIGVVVADSFARAFYRNAINNALPVIALPGVSERISEGDILEVDVVSGAIRDITTGETWQSAPTPDFIVKIYECGGAIPYYRAKLKGEN
jgi:3-isopropylmalate/(R)-2-methylmalate dehydratase small subunit